VPSTNSPYDPPRSRIDADIAERLEVVPARRWLRFANFVVDYIVTMALGVVVGVVVALVWGPDGVRFIQALPRYAFGATLFLVYYITLETLTGRTVGKWVTGTTVVDERGVRPSFGQIVGRSFARLIPLEPLSFFGQNARGWHDSLPKTYVVKYR